jgi:hypothetical protein
VNSASTNFEFFAKISFFVDFAMFFSTSCLNFFMNQGGNMQKKREKGVHREIGKGPNQALGS